VDLNSLPPDVAEELEAVVKAINGLRAGAANHTPSRSIPTSDPAVVAVSQANEGAMKDLVPLGFTSLGYAGEPRKDGSIAASLWFRHEDGTVCGWLGFIKTKDGPRLVLFFMTELPGPAYCTTIRGGSGLSLARPPFVSHADLDAKVSLTEMLAQHRARVSSLPATPTKVATMEDAIAMIERLHQSRMDWRASIAEDELFRADCKSVLANSYRTMKPGDFRLIYSNAVEWLGFQPEQELGTFTYRLKRS